MENTDIDILRHRLYELINTWINKALECREYADEYEKKFKRPSIYWSSCAEILGAAIEQLRKVLAHGGPMEAFEAVPVGTKAHIAELEQKIRELELEVEGLNEALNHMYLHLHDEDDLPAL